MVATDAISEGYNLHRAGTIINYDIPFNPTRVIQRIGRINRINKKMFEELYIYNYFPTDIGENEARTKEISTLKMAMIHAIMGEDTKALTKDEEIRSFFKERYKKELANSEEASWDSPYKKLLDELKGTDIYNQAMKIPHRARTGRKVKKTYSGVLMFGKKGNDYVFKIGQKNSISQLTAEQAFSLFEAQAEENAYPVSEQFDAVYQLIKKQLFSSDIKIKNDKERLKVYDKIKVISQSKTLNDDYLKDLMKVVKTDNISGYELRFINQLSPKEYLKLPQTITQEYLSRCIWADSKVDEGKETLILSEEIDGLTNE